ncbi:GNAT family N-acetyltransferase [Streptomyces sp. NPDC001941]|uniref:GNAT family N-acetyltransferase n=1 Tax=Streptomyces sp. NPDC001941 TaxID=3154659 RepID=UPI0033298438
MQISPIETAGLTLVPLAVSHAAEMAGILADPALHSFIGGTPCSAEELTARYERLVAGSPDPAQLWWNWVVRLRDENRLTGTVQATLTRTDGGWTAEVAWVVGTAWQGRGIASEAARGLVDGLRAQGVRDVHAHVHPEHTASAAVARAAGLAPTDRVRDGEIRWELP